MKILLDPQYARAFAEAYLEKIDDIDWLRAAVDGRPVAIIGTGPSARGLSQVSEGRQVYLNGAHALVGDVPAGWTVGFMVDPTKRYYGIYEGDPLDGYILPEDTEEARGLERNIWRMPGPFPIAPRGSQSCVVWLFAAMGAREIHLYGCDGAWDECLNGYDGKFEQGSASWLYPMQPRWAVTLAGGCPLTWHRGEDRLTHQDITPAPVKVIPAWQSLYHECMKATLTS